MARLKQSIAGCAVSYECEDLDAGLPMHAHAPGSGLEHDIRCDAGAILVYVYPADHHTVQAGETLRIDTTRWHGIAPLTIGAAFTNTSSTDMGNSSTVLEAPHNAPDWVLKLLAQFHA